MLIPDSPDTFRFGDFELDVGAYALRRNGRPVRIERQPMDLLLLLVERRGQLVLRSEIVDRLWGKDVFVDVETGVHTAIRKVRQALRDSPDAPTFVETVSGKGYRFIAPVEVLWRAARCSRPCQGSASGGRDRIRCGFCRATACGGERALRRWSADRDRQGGGSDASRGR